MTLRSGRVGHDPSADVDVATWHALTAPSLAKTRSGPLPGVAFYNRLPSGFPSLSIMVV